MSDVWVQVYNPMGHWIPSTLLAAVPVLLLMGLLVSGKANAWQSALAGLAASLLIAIAGFRMPWTMALGAAGVGLVFALVNIAWLITAAVFLYDLAVATGQFAVMRASIAGLSEDRRLQAVLVAFAFGAFIEGVAGFGAPVAISAAFLVGLGFPPLQAAILCLVANTAPVAWGSIGIPIRTLGDVTGLDIHALSQMAGRILPPISLIIPLWLVRMMVPWKQTLQIWPALLAIGGAFAITQWAWSQFVGVELVDLASAASALFAGVILMRTWQPRDVVRFAEDPEPGSGPAAPDRRAVLKAWMPFGLLSLVVLLWGIPPVKKAINDATSWNPGMPGLHLMVAKGEAVSGHAEATEKDRLKADLPITPISATGTAVFLAAFASGLILGVSPGKQAAILGKTVRRLLPAYAAILGMLALGNVTKYSGMDAVLGLAMTRTGAWLYPIFGTLLGWLGVALTGSDTASNVLFGNLQVITADKMGLSPILMASANSTGGVMGKMIDAQSIVVAAAAAGEKGQEGPILRAVLRHSLVLALLVGLIVWIYAHLAPWAIPS